MRMRFHRPRGPPGGRAGGPASAKKQLARLASVRYVSDHETPGEPGSSPMASRLSGEQVLKVRAFRIDVVVDAEHGTRQPIASRRVEPGTSNLARLRLYCQSCISPADRGRRCAAFPDNVDVRRSVHRTGFESTCTIRNQTPVMGVEHGVEHAEKASLPGPSPKAGSASCRRWGLWRRGGPTSGGF